MFDGYLRLDPAMATLTLRPRDPVLATAMLARLGPGRPLPDRIIYEGVDATDLRRTLETRFTTTEQRSAIAALLAGAAEVSVLAGTPLVEHAAGARRYTITCLDDINGGAAALWINPAWYVDGAPDYFARLEGHAWRASLAHPHWSFASSSTTTLFVRQRRGVNANAYPADTKPFTDKDRPARRLQDAINAADPFDTILVLDTAVYDEGPITLIKAITIESSAVSAPDGSSGRAARRASDRPPSHACVLGEATASC
jgi:hypothetical protein